MKILAFVDVHGDKKCIENIIKKSRDVDVLVCAGDLTTFGLSLNKVFDEIIKTNKEFLFIHGNHEESFEDLGLLKSIKNKNFTYLHRNFYIKEDYVFIGYGGGGFSQEDKEMERFFDKIYSKIDMSKKIILVTHAPPFKTRVDFLPHLGYRGNKSINRVIKKFKPVLLICGHLHETAGVTDRIGETLIINPGSKGKIIEI